MLKLLNQISLPILCLLSPCIFFFFIFSIECCLMCLYFCESHSRAINLDTRGIFLKIVEARYQIVQIRTHIVISKLRTSNSSIFSKLSPAFVALYLNVRYFQMRFCIKWPFLCHTKIVHYLETLYLMLRHI